VNARRNLAAGAAAVTILLTAAAFWLSYEHLHDVAAENGLGGDAARAWAWPACLDLFIVAGELLMLRGSLAGRVDWWAVGLTAVGSLGSIGLNVSGVGAHADPLEYVVAAVPPVAALLAFGAVMRQVHERLASTSEEPGEYVPEHGGEYAAVPEGAGAGVPEYTDGVPEYATKVGSEPPAVLAEYTQGVPDRAPASKSVTDEIDNGGWVDTTVARSSSLWEPPRAVAEGGAGAPDPLEVAQEAHDRVFAGSPTRTRGEYVPAAGVLPAVAEAPPAPPVYSAVEADRTRVEVRAEYVPELASTPTPGVLAEASTADVDVLADGVQGGDVPGHPGPDVPAEPAVASTPEPDVPQKVRVTKQRPRKAAPTAPPAESEDELTVKARGDFADVLADGRLPSIRALKNQYSIGQPRAEKIRAQLA
jgi:hypothetical protein